MGSIPTGVHEGGRWIDGRISAILLGMRACCVAGMLVLSIAFPCVGHAQESERDAAARAAFERARSSNDFDSFRIPSRAWLGLEDYVQSLAQSIEDAARRARGAADRYDAVRVHGSPRWSIAALVEQGRVYETLARIVETVPTMPDVPREAMDRIVRAVRRRLHPAECTAIERYALAARAARASGLDTDASRAALDRLRAYGDARIAECGAHEPLPPSPRRNPSR